METNQLEVLARLVLPSEILDYFSMVSAEHPLVRFVFILTS